MKPGEQPIDELTRDKVFAEMRHQNDNNICIDCEKKNPKWASIHLGIHLCIDCAGKHRQYGVIYSFVKSTNLDIWNHKQLLYMQKGSNARAIEYFKKCGIINANNRHIDYKLTVVQKYKKLLTDEVEMELAEPEIKREKEKEKEETNTNSNIGKNKENFIGQGDPFDEKINEETTKEIPTAEIIEGKGPKSKKSKDRKKIGAKQINIEDFDNMAFDDGVPIEIKEKIVKEYEKPKEEDKPTEDNHISKTTSTTTIEEPKIPEPKEMTATEAAKKMEELKSQTNIKAISSETFKDTTIDNVTLKQTMEKFQNSSSISSSSFFNKPAENQNETIDKIKDIVANVSETVYTKLASYWGK